MVVRDAKGQAVRNLTKDDFQLFDKGKRQKITKFSVEETGGETMAKPAASANPAGAQVAKPTTVAENFIAYLFDDVHLKAEDLARVRDAASQNMDALPPNARAAIFTTSSVGALDFTADRAKLHAALLELRAHTPTASGPQACPAVSYYMADLILNKYNPNGEGNLTYDPPLHAATLEAMDCMHMSHQPTQSQEVDEAARMAKAAARRALEEGSRESRVPLLALMRLVRGVSAMPGRRNIILISPGFFVPVQLGFEEAEVMDLAIRSSVVISALDARGLYAITPGGEIKDRGTDPDEAGLREQYRRADARAASVVLAEMAAGTGGTFIQNTNDFEAGFRRFVTVPEYIYMLGFAPQNLKPDGRFHPLKVKLHSSGKLSLQARHGYFAPRGRKSETPAK